MEITKTTTKKRIALFTLVAAATVLLPGERTSHAWTPQQWCNGTVKWSGPTRMARDRCSMSGTDPFWAYYNAGQQWWQVSPMMDVNWSYDSGCTIGLNNGLNQTAIVPRAHISGYLGLPTYHY